MPIEIVQLFVRPSVDVPWFHETWPESHMNYLQTHYKDTGKFQGKREILEDGLTMVNTYIFTDASAEIEFMSDPYLAEMVEKRNAYNEANNIFSA